MPQELRLHGITTVEAANRFLRERYIAEFNHRFMVAAREKGNAFRRSALKDLDWIFSIQTQRTVNGDNTVVLDHRVLQIEKTRWRNTLVGCTVVVHEMRDGSLVLRYGPHEVARWTPENLPAPSRSPRRQPARPLGHNRSAA